jgi:hypothetical protein
MIVNQTRYNELHILEQVERLIAWNHDEFIYKLGKNEQFKYLWVVFSPKFLFLFSKHPIKFLVFVNHDIAG